MDIKKYLHKKVKFEIWSLFIFIIAIISLLISFSFIANYLFKIGSTPPSIEERLDDSKWIIPGLDNDKTSYISNLDGSNINNETVLETPIAIIIENYAPIRDQQLGLEDALIVYETLAEGGITRFLAIYGNNSIPKIGPVRSARPYFINWAEEVSAIFVHIGGSNSALENLKVSKKVFDIDEYTENNVIWRDDQYSAPHNAFVSTEEVTDYAIENQYYNKINKSRFKFKELEKNTGDIHLIKIPFSITPYDVKYKYNTETGLYDRYNGEDRHHKISPANIIVQFTEQKVLDNEGRLQIQTSGGGNMLVFLDGKVIGGKWEKTDGFTKFFNEKEEEIELNQGQTWIEVVPNKLIVNYF